MARISISDLYRGEGPGEKYGGILNAVMQEVLTNGVPEGCDERTWIELLTVNRPFSRQCKWQNKATRYRNCPMLRRLVVSPGIERNPVAAHSVRHARPSRNGRR